MSENIPVEFIGSYVHWRDVPTRKPAFAFVGRSNVGKSSLINSLANNRKLAHTSANPGKTQTINYFEVNKQWHLVDLPGYGFAKTARTQREAWAKMIDEYLRHCPDLFCVFVLVDIRIRPQTSDLEFIQNLGENSIPLAVVFTKSDSLTKRELRDSLSIYNQALSQSWQELPKSFVTSAKQNLGRDEILSFIHESLRGV